MWIFPFLITLLTFNSLHTCYRHTRSRSLLIKRKTRFEWLWMQLRTCDYFNFVFELLWRFYISSKQRPTQKWRQVNKIIIFCHLVFSFFSLMNFFWDLTAATINDDVCFSFSYSLFKKWMQLFCYRLSMQKLKLTKIQQPVFLIGNLQGKG